MTTLLGYGTIAIILFSIGVTGVVARRNIFVMYMSIELMLNAVNLLLVVFSRLHEDMDGQIIAMMIIAIAAAEAAIFLTVMILLFRSKGSLDSNLFIKLRPEINR